MKRSQREAAMRGSTHLLRLSLPAVRSNGSFEGADILAEDGAVPASVLYPAYRSVMAWALTPAAEHPGLFPAGAGDETRRLMAAAEVPRELDPALQTLCEMLDDPPGADASRVSEACMRIGEWAERLGSAPATALRFLQAAATCSPNDARVAYRAGYVARHQAIWDVAELWFRHSGTVGRRTRDWRSHALAYTAVGNCFYQRGRHQLAKREHLKALRVSRRHGLTELEGMAYHDLFAVAIELGDWSEADVCAQRSFHAYGAEHRNVPNLAHDVAYFWNTRGHYSRALPVFLALLPHYTRPQNRIRVLGAIARAAGGCGEREVFNRASEELWGLVPLIEREPALPASLLQNAYGAAALQNWELARAGAEFALRAAVARGEADVITDAERTLDLISRESIQDLRSEPTAAGGSSGADLLAEELVASLQSCEVGR
jgi:tetratricopeptide (TPR) repeat protein